MKINYATIKWVLIHTYMYLLKDDNESNYFLLKIIKKQKRTNQMQAKSEKNWNILKLSRRKKF